MLLFALVRLAMATVPLPTYPSCGEPDRPDLCPPDAEGDWALLSYVPAAWRGQVRAEEAATGISADRAWRVTTGRTDVVLAVLDSGILWDDVDLLRKHYLNAAELPLPQSADGSTASAHDANGDGVFNAVDYAADPRVSPDASPNGIPGVVDPADLIATFSDGVDDDANGYLDDISGWDFLWNDNDPYDDTRYDHGTYEAEEAAKEADDGRGGVGVCPNCMVMSVRVSDSFVADGGHFAAAALFSVDSGASVIQEALGTLNHPSTARWALDYAWDHNVLVIASAADETSYHPNSPGWDARTLYVHAIVPNDDADESESFLAYSNCTNHGARLDLSATSTGCSSGATAVTSGVAGLALSAARDAGLVLSAGELKHLLMSTADDIDVPESREEGSAYYPSAPGWDRYFGHGRINAETAVRQAAAGQIPPAPEIRSPGWFLTIDPVAFPSLTIEGVVSARGGVASWTLEAGLGDEPTELVAISSGSAAAAGALGNLDWSALAIDPEAPIPTWEYSDDQVRREDLVNASTVTLVLTVTDAAGLKSVERRAFYARHDPTLLTGFPMALGSSLEASPQLADLDGDGVNDIIQLVSDGTVVAMHGDGTPLPGWPVQLGLVEESDPDHASNHLASPGFSAMPAPMRPSAFATPAVADLDGDGSPEVVVATLRGALHVFDATGRPRAGFPVAQEPVSQTSPTRVLDEGFFSSPAVADLDGDGRKEIVLGGMDQQLYAFDADGAAVPGFPVRLVYPGFEDTWARIISSPAVGDVDGDGRAEIAIGTNEALGATNGAVYLVGADGQYKSGWPQLIFGAYTQALPYVGEGVPTSPAMADLDGDGDLEIAAFTQAGDYIVFEHDGTWRWAADKAADRYGAGSNVADATSFPLINNPSFGDLNNDGVPELVTGGVGADYAVGMLFDGRRMPFSFTLNAWDGTNGKYLPVFPRAMEDLQFFTAPAIADIDGDGAPEIITGTGGFLVHAINRYGHEPEGWPKLTGQWNMASPAVGDVNGDGFLDVVQATRAGFLFVWGTTSPAGAKVAWASFRHDPANTGNHETPLVGYNAGYPAEEDTKRCGCASAPGPALWAALAALGLARRRSTAR